VAVGQRGEGRGGRGSAHGGTRHGDREGSGRASRRSDRRRHGRAARSKPLAGCRRWTSTSDPFVARGLAERRGPRLPGRPDEGRGRSGRSPDAARPPPPPPPPPPVDEDGTCGRQIDALSDTRGERTGSQPPTPQQPRSTVPPGTSISCRLPARRRERREAVFSPDGSRFYHGSAPAARLAATASAERIASTADGEDAAGVAGAPRQRRIESPVLTLARSPRGGIRSGRRTSAYRAGQEGRLHGEPAIVARRGSAVADRRDGVVRQEVADSPGARRAGTRAAPRRSESRGGRRGIADPLGGPTRRCAPSAKARVLQCAAARPAQRPQWDSPPE